MGDTKYAVHISLGVIKYVTNFMKIGCATQKLVKGIYKFREQGDGSSMLYFFLNNGSRLRNYAKQPWLNIKDSR
jgi:hypothetical protein